MVVRRSLLALASLALAPAPALAQSPGERALLDAARGADKAGPVVSNAPSFLVEAVLSRADGQGAVRMSAHLQAWVGGPMEARNERAVSYLHSVRVSEAPCPSDGGCPPHVRRELGVMTVGQSLSVRVERVEEGFAVLRVRRESSELARMDRFSGVPGIPAIELPHRTETALVRTVRVRLGGSVEMPTPEGGTLRLSVTETADSRI